MATPCTLSEAACSVLNDPCPASKVSKTREYVAAWKFGEISEIGVSSPPNHPARPLKPELRSPRDMPRRRPTGNSGRFAFVHAIAHIELNAIDLAWDIVVRFTNDNLPREFYDDWSMVALDEAEHFDLLERRLTELGGAYGDLAAHDGLWEAAISTRDDLLARLAIVPMILEARGLDTTPGAIARLQQAGDEKTAETLEIIAREEIPHVRAGVHWFEILCHQRGVDPISTFHHLIRSKFKGAPKPPFNEAARTEAGMASEYYSCYQER